MVLRVMQIFVPVGTDDTINELLEGREVLGRWRDTDAGQIVLHLLVPAEDTEPIMDRFEQKFGDTKGFQKRCQTLYKEMPDTLLIRYLFALLIRPRDALRT